MMDSLYQPDLSIGFIWVVALAFFFLMKSFVPDSISLRSKIILAFLITGWLALQGVLSSKGFYLDFTGFPPRFAMAIGPPLLFILFLFIFRRKILQYFSLKILTWLHIIRIPVEIILFGLYLDKQIPQLMTFEGRNFDILSGLTAPVIAYCCFTKNLLSWKVALVWNFICLVLLLNIFVHAILSAPFVFQQFAFDQPNVAVAYFPFIWLPSFVVPLVLFSHLVSIVRLLPAMKKNIQ